MNTILPPTLSQFCDSNTADANAPGMNTRGDVRASHVSPVRSAQRSRGAGQEHDPIARRARLVARSAGLRGGLAPHFRGACGAPGAQHLAGQPGAPGHCTRRADSPAAPALNRTKVPHGPALGPVPLSSQAQSVRFSLPSLARRARSLVLCLAGFGFGRLRAARRPSRAMRRPIGLARHPPRVARHRIWPAGRVASLDRSHSRVLRAAPKPRRATPNRRRLAQID